MDTLVLQVEPTRVWEVKNAAPLASAREDTEGLVQKVAFLKGELAEVRRVWEVVEQKFYSLFDVLADDMR
jgi:hypothetical protein